MWPESKWIEVATAITSELHRLSAKILNGETRWVKFNGNVIITSELFHRDEVLDQRGRDENIA